MRVHASEKSELKLELFQEFEVQGQVYLVTEVEKTEHGTIYTLGQS
jgi:hypothetical protein